MISTVINTHEDMMTSIEEKEMVIRTQAVSRNLTPAQMRAVEIAKQQVLRAQRARVAKDEREAARSRMWANSESDDPMPLGLLRDNSNNSDADSAFSLRKIQGGVLRSLRTQDRKTLREISQKAGVSLGYLSEVERGQKEASSELLTSITDALGVKLSEMLMMVANRVSEYEEAGKR